VRLLRPAVANTARDINPPPQSDGLSAATIDSVAAAPSMETRTATPSSSFAGSSAPRSSSAPDRFRVRIRPSKTWHQNCAPLPRIQDARFSDRKRENSSAKKKALGTRTMAASSPWRLPMGARMRPRRIFEATRRAILAE